MDEMLSTDKSRKAFFAKLKTQGIHTKEYSFKHPSSTSAPVQFRATTSKSRSWNTTISRTPGNPKAELNADLSMTSKSGKISVNAGSKFLTRKTIEGLMGTNNSVRKHFADKARKARKQGAKGKLSLTNTGKSVDFSDFV